MEQIRTTPPGRKALHLLDDISDIACHATDAANICTSAHADPAWRTAAQNAAVKLNSYLSTLNTEPILWRSLDKTMAARNAASSDATTHEHWTKEEVKAGESLLLEFEQAGMRADADAAARYREQTANEQALCASLVRFEVCIAVHH